MPGTGRNGFGSGGGCQDWAGVAALGAAEPRDALPVPGLDQDGWLERDPVGGGAYLLKPL